MSYSAHMAKLLDKVRDTFGATVTYDPSGAAAPFSVRGVLEPPAQLEETFPDSYVTLFVKLADFAVPPAKGDKVTVAGQNYVVVAVEADPEGGARLKLHQAS